MASTRECHRIPLSKGPNVPEGPGVEDVVEVGRYLLDGEKKYVNRGWCDDEMRIIPLLAEEEGEENPVNRNEGFLPVLEVNQNPVNLNEGFLPVLEVNQNPVNLNEGFDRTRWEEKTVNGNVLETDLKMYHALFEWIYIKAYDLAANKIRIVANGAALCDLLQAPYGWKNPDSHPSSVFKNPDSHPSSVFTIYLSRHNSVLYMFRFYEPQSEADLQFRLIKYRGKKFRSSMTRNLLGDGCEENNGDSDCKRGGSDCKREHSDWKREHSDWKRRVVNKAAFRGVNMLYTTRVSAVDSKGRFVSLHVIPEDNLGKCSYYRKLLRQWSVALFTPAPSIVIGLRQRQEDERDEKSHVFLTGVKRQEDERDEKSHVFLTGVKRISTAAIPDVVKEHTVLGKRTIWEPRYCFKNFESVLHTLLAVTEDDPKTVYCLASENNQHGYVDRLVLRKMDPQLGIQVIPAWYID